jgi:hypothetical protein|tara:strand:+ start:74 stop:283 length:210 start_codon:yes stop_codon:yes gene_type:complete
MANQREAKILQSLSPKGRWITMKKGTFADVKASGKAIRVIHPSGSFKVIANAEALGEDAETSFRHVAAA